jgi:hypothetical protein
MSLREPEAIRRTGPAKPPLPREHPVEPDGSTAPASPATGEAAAAAVAIATAGTVNLREGEEAKRASFRASPSRSQAFST